MDSVKYTFTWLKQLIKKSTRPVLRIDDLLLRVFNNKL